MALKEYKHGAAFPGTIGRTVNDSSPAWPEPNRARTGAPNVLFWIIDDVGYGQMSAFGGLVNTPNIDRLANNGLRYTNMHTTALCSPTRACMLTGRNHHSNGLAAITEFATGYPGYDGRMPFENGMLSEMLLENGYNTFCTGKWHLNPTEEGTPAGPYHRWPLGRGFERFYGFLGGETNQWFPDLTYDNHSVPQPKSVEEGYHLTEDLSDKAIQFILDAHVNAPDKPFFLYHATGAAHAPHQVGQEWIDKYKGKFDMGWDKYREIVFENQKKLGIFPANAELSRHDPDVPAWDTLSADQKRLYTRLMEVFAGFLEHADHHFGRILKTLEDIGELDNTLIMIVPDNGASSEGGADGCFNEMSSFNQRWETLEEILPRIDQLGGPTSYNHYPWGWAWAGNTPFRRWKKEVYRGGCTDNLIVSWPAGIKAKGEAARAVRARDRHGADRAGGAGDRAAREDSRRHAVADRGRLVRAHLQRREGADQSHHPVLRDVRQPGDLQRRLASQLRLSGTELRRGRGEGAQVGRADHQRGAGRSGDQRLGAVPRRRGSGRMPQPRRRSIPKSCASWSRCGGPRRASTRCCRSTAASSSGQSRSARS